MIYSKMFAGSIGDEDSKQDKIESFLNMLIDKCFLSTKGFIA